MNLEMNKNTVKADNPGGQSESGRHEGREQGDTPVLTKKTNDAPPRWGNVRMATRRKPTSESKTMNTTKQSLTVLIMVGCEEVGQNIANALAKSNR